MGSGGPPGAASASCMAVTRRCISSPAGKMRAGCRAARASLRRGAPPCRQIHVQSCSGARQFIIIVSVRRLPYRLQLRRCRRPSASQQDYCTVTPDLVGQPTRDSSRGRRKITHPVQRALRAVSRFLRPVEIPGEGAAPLGFKPLLRDHPVFVVELQDRSSRRILRRPAGRLPDPPCSMRALRGTRCRSRRVPGLRACSRLELRRGTSWSCPPHSVAQEAHKRLVYDPLLREQRHHIGARFGYRVACRSLTTHRVHIARYGTSVLSPNATCP